MSGERLRPSVFINLAPEPDLEQEYENTTSKFSEEERVGKEANISAVFESLKTRLAAYADVKFSEHDFDLLRLKLARYFQHADAIDANTLFDAIIESPGFIQKEKGGLHRLLEVHEQKTLQAIAEIRKKQAEIKGDKKFNPYESLFTTKSGDWYLARLLNMPHLEKESEYMRHCVGTSDSYINKMKRGEVEIFSLRCVPEIDENTGKLAESQPVLTIEYDVKNKKILQMKKADDELVEWEDFDKFDLLDVLAKASETTTDTGDTRDFWNIAPSELEDCRIDDEHVFTRLGGVVHYSKYDFSKDGLVIKAGHMPVESLPKADVATIVWMLKGIEVKPEQIARKESEVSDQTTLYIGPLYQDFFKTIPDTVEHIFSCAEAKEIKPANIWIGGKDAEQLIKEHKQKGLHMDHISSVLMRNKHPDNQPGEFRTQEEAERIHLIQLTVRDLGFINGATTDQIYAKGKEMGLELCPQEAGPNYRLQYPNQPTGEHFSIAMKQFPGPSSTGHMGIFNLYHDEEGVWLHSSWKRPKDKWHPNREFVFRLPSSRQPARNDFVVAKSGG